MKNIRSDKTVRLCRKAQVIKRLTIVFAILVLIGGIKSTLNLQNVSAEASPKATSLVKEIIDEVRNTIDSIPTYTEENIKREDAFLKVVEKRYNQNVVEPTEEEVIEETYYEDSYVEEGYTDESYDEYYEELYFVSRINKDNNKKYYFASDIAKDDCKVVTKTFYREKEEYEK